MSSPAPRSWRNMQPETEVRVPLTVRLADLDAFSRLSGDVNPLHLDAAYARRMGHKGRVVYGALIVGAVSRLLGTKLPGPGCLWQSVSLQFTAPLYAGQAAVVVGRVVYASQELSVVRLALEVRAKRRLIARGQAQAQLLRAPGT